MSFLDRVRSAVDNAVGRIRETAANISDRFSSARMTVVEFVSGKSKSEEAEIFGVQKSDSVEVVVQQTFEEENNDDEEIIQETIREIERYIDSLYDSISTDDYDSLVSMVRYIQNMDDAEVLISEISETEARAAKNNEWLKNQIEEMISEIPAGEFQDKWRERLINSSPNEFESLFSSIQRFVFGTVENRDEWLNEMNVSNGEKTPAGWLFRRSFIDQSSLKNWLMGTGITAYWFVVARSDGTYDVFEQPSESATLTDSTSLNSHMDSGDSVFIK